MALAFDLRSVEFDRWSVELAEWFDALPLSPDLRTLVARLAGLGVLLLLALVARILFKAYMARLEKTAPKDSVVSLLYRHGVLVAQPRLVPGIVVALFNPFIFSHDQWMRHAVAVVVGIYLTVIIAMMVYRTLNAVYERYSEHERSGHFALKNLIQAGKVVLFLFAALTILALLFDESPLLVLSGLGAVTAVFLLIFKDSLLGLVAGVQLNINNMVRLGDWIELPDQSANGTVVDIALTTIKIQNFDNTISCIPSYTLINQPFINWRGMSDSGGRRICRSLFIDLQSIRFSEPSEIEELRKLQVLRAEIDTRCAEIHDFNKARGVDPSFPGNGHRLTNVGLFRAYCAAYLRCCEDVHGEGFTFLVRHLQPEPTGLPIQIYVFTKTVDWAAYEGIQADIFDHLIAVLPHFGLRIFQNPSGADVRALHFQLEGAREQADPPRSSKH